MATTTRSTVARRIAVSSLLIGTLSVGSIGAASATAAQPVVIAPVSSSSAPAAPAFNFHNMLAPVAQAFQNTINEHQRRTNDALPTFPAR